jgi:hypothetical protein
VKGLRLLTLTFHLPETKVVRSLSLSQLSLRVADARLSKQAWCNFFGYKGSQFFDCSFHTSIGVIPMSRDLSAANVAFHGSFGEIIVFWSRKAWPANMGYSYACDVQLAVESG